MSGAASAEIVTIGTELLLGDTIDTNAAWLGARLAAAGIPVARRTTVGDEQDHIVEAVRTACGRASLVICTGGLGPTTDDLTREAVASACSSPLALDDAWVDVLRARFAARGIPMSENNVRQAMVPAGGLLLPNDRGTAPGIWLELQDCVVVLLPGVPSELHWLFEQAVEPRIRARWPHARPVRSARLRTTGIAEGTLGQRIAPLLGEIAPLSVAFLPSAGGVDLRITDFSGGDDAALQSVAARLRGIIGEYVYDDDNRDLAEVVGSQLHARGWRIALAESCTGGLVAKRLTDVPGSSAYVAGGWVTYANETKTAWLNVPPELLASAGAVSEAAVRTMAENARALAGAECALAISGIAGPGGATPGKPVGTVWIALATADTTEARLFNLFGQRTEIRERAAQAALSLLRRHLAALP